MSDSLELPGVSNSEWGRWGRKGAEIPFPSPEWHPLFSGMSDKRINCDTAKPRRRGGVVRTARGVFQVTWPLAKDPVTGKRKRGKHNFHGTKAEAERFLAERIRESELEKRRMETVGPHPEPPCPQYTLGEWMDVHFDDFCRALRRSTRDGYRAVIRNHFPEDVLAIPLAELRPAHIQRVLNTMLDKGLAISTVRGARAAVQGALTRAMKEELVVRNVAALVDLPPLPQRDMNVFDAEQTRIFLEFARRDRWFAYWTLQVTCGLRPSEGLGLRWGDLNRTQLSVQRSLVRSRGGEWTLGKTKTGRSRVIELPALTAEALREHRAVQVGERLAAGPEYKDHDLIFACRNGEPLDLGNLKRRHFFPLLERAGLPRIRLYDLRHTAATLRIQNGDHAKTIQELLGHASSALTLNVYSHVLPAVRQESAARMDALLRRAIEG